jgi:hypothetical protein
MSVSVPYDDQHPLLLADMSAYAVGALDVGARLWSAAPMALPWPLPLRAFGRRALSFLVAPLRPACPRLVVVVVVMMMLMMMNQ